MILSKKAKNFYPRPPRGGRRIWLVSSPPVYHISIHALREEGDRLCFFLTVCKQDISIHALREEGDQWNGEVQQ